MHWRTKLQHEATNVSTDFRSLTTPVYRGSTVDDLAQALLAV